jgi:uncharacterized membrane protein
MNAVIRQQLIKSTPLTEANGFRVRGEQVSRLEAISDAVFGLAITLIVVTLKVPETLDELIVTLKGFIGSGVCTFLVLQIWNQHYLYFRRYGLEDITTRSLNGLLLFLIIAYVYPLKFLFALFFDQLLEIKARPNPMRQQDHPLLFAVYGAGFVLVYAVFALMYWHALKKREELELDDREVLLTRWTILEHCLVALAGVLSILFALSSGPRLSIYAGFVYFLIPVFMTIHGMKFGDAMRKLEGEKKMRDEAALSSKIEA